MDRRVAALAVGTVAVAWPAVSSVLGLGSSDGFPLSTYPMFARDPGRVVELPTVVAVDAHDRVERLSPETIADTDQVIQALVTVRRAVAGGPDAAEALCLDVADRVDAGVRVEVVVERWDSIAWAAGEREPRDRRVVASCEAAGR